MTTSREIHLAARPEGWPTPDTFRLVEVEVPEPGPGEVLVRNQYLSVDPYMRGRMNDVPSYVPPFVVGAVMDGGAIGIVEASADPTVPVGTQVVHMYGWRDHVVAPARHFQAIVPQEGIPAIAHLGPLGVPGLTAYVGLLDIAAFKPGDVVFVSGAAGAVGALVGQIAKLKGAARVIGSAGSAAKVDYLLGLGFDAAFNYRDAPVHRQLRESIDVYFDNVGGDHLEAALSRLTNHGRVALCGAISAYNATEPPTAPRNLALAITKRLSLRGFIVIDHGDRQPDLVAEVGPWLRDGRLRADETFVDGLENAPAAFLGMMRGDNIGKMIVRL